MEKYRGKTLEEWKKYIKEDKQVGIRATKYILVLEELVEELQSKLHQPTVISRFDSDVFIPPFRLGRKQKRAILDAKGREVIIMPHNSEKQAQLYCDYLNGL